MQSPEQNHITFPSTILIEHLSYNRMFSALKEVVAGILYHVTQIT